jgi:hypothetical protein
MSTNFNFNLNLNTQQFQQAIGDVGRQTRGLFDQLQQYSKQYQRTGFLGLGDQRVLLQSMQHWERMSRQLHLEQLGVQGQLQQLQSQGPLTQAQAQQFQRLQGLQAQLQARQQGMATLQGGFSNWDAMQQQLQAQLQASQGGGNLRGYAASAGIALLQRHGGPVGQILGAGLTGFAYGGPPGAAIGAGVAAVGVAFDKGREAMDAWIARARGVSAVGQLLDQNFGAITEQVIELKDQFKILTPDALAAMEAMSRATGRLERRPLERAIGFGVAYGMAPAQAAGLAGTMQMLGAPTRYGPLASVAAGARTAFGTGGLPMRMDVLQEEAGRIAQIGGTAAAPMDPEFYGRMVGVISGMGPRYQLPGAAAGFAERLSQGLSQAPDPAVLMLRHRAIEQLYQERKAAGLPTTITIGRGRNAEQVDLGSYEGRRIAMEMAGQSSLIQGAYGRTIEEFRFDPELYAQAFERMIGGGRLGPRESRAWRRTLEAGGGPEQILEAPGKYTPAGEAARVGERVETWKRAPEALPQLVEAARQAIMERLGTEGVAGFNAPEFLKLQLKSIEVTGELDKTVRDQFSALGQAIGTHFPTLGTSMSQLADAMLKTGQQIQQSMAAAASQGWGPWAQALIAGGGLAESGWNQIRATPNIPGGVDTPYGHFQLLPFGWSVPNPLHTTKPTPAK